MSRNPTVVKNHYDRWVLGPWPAMVRIMTSEDVISSGYGADGHWMALYHRRLSGTPPPIDPADWWHFHTYTDHPSVRLVTFSLLGFRHRYRWSSLCNSKWCHVAPARGDKVLTMRSIPCFLHTPVKCIIQVYYMHHHPPYITLITAPHVEYYHL